MKEMLGSELASVRREQNLPQRYLARELKCSVSCIAEWERGRNTPSIHNLIRLGDILDSYRFDCALASFITNGRLGIVAAVNGGALGALAALVDEIEDLEQYVKAAKRALYRHIEDADNAEALLKLRKNIRDIQYTGNAAEVHCDQIKRMSARMLAEEYARTRPGYVQMKNHPAGSRVA